MDAQETVATYVKRVRAIKAQSIALIPANLVAMIWFVEEGHFALYLVCFVFLLAIVLFASVRERVEFSDYPECFEGFPICLVSAALLALAFMGFSGMSIPV